jgi:hypothetical protein
MNSGYSVQVVHMRDAKLAKAVKVDRSSAWGNPFIMESESSRDYVCDLYEQYAKWRLTVEPDWLTPLRERNLACWCHPKRCHADTLLRLANTMTETAISLSR